MLAHTVCAPGAHGFFWFPLIPLFFFGFWVLVLFVVRPWAWRRRGTWLRTGLVAVRIRRGGAGRAVRPRRGRRVRVPGAARGAARGR